MFCARRDIRSARGSTPERCRAWVVSGLFCVAVVTGPPSPAKAAQAAENLLCEVSGDREADLLARCSGPDADHGRDIVISLMGTTPDRVREVRLRWSDEAAPFQTIAARFRPVIDVETVGVIYKDMNFDGAKDLAVMRALSGPEAGYRFFLFEADSGRFVTSPALDALDWPEFDSRRREVRTSEPAPEGAITHLRHVWNGDRLELRSRVTRRMSADGTCIESRTPYTDGVPQETRDRPCS